MPGSISESIHIGSSFQRDAISNANDKRQTAELAGDGRFNLKERVLNHWWEAPTGSGQKGRAVSCVFTSMNTTSSPRTESKIAPAENVLMDNDDAAATAGCAETGSVSKSALAASNGLLKEGEIERNSASRWSDQEGKLIVQSDMFSSVLPSADEVGLQWRISELRVALQASERARVEGEQETQTLRKYLAEVESAAATLQLRVQELEHLINYSSRDEVRELDQLRAKMALEASKETQNQTTRASMAVAAAREATMELDKVKRHASSLIRAQAEEIERLRKEAADCRTLSHARTGQLEALKEQIATLEKELPNSAYDALRVSEEKIMQLERCLSEAKMAAEEKSSQLTELLHTYEHEKNLVQSSLSRLTEMELEKDDLSRRNELLEQQVLYTFVCPLLRSKKRINTFFSLPTGYWLGGQRWFAPTGPMQMREAQQSEKQQILSELETLRCENRTLQTQLMEWQNKFHVKHGDASLGLCLTCKRKKLQASREGGGKCCSQRSSVVTMIETVGGITRSQIPTHQNEWTTCPYANSVKDTLLAAAHKEIVRLKEMNQCLLAAFEHDIRMARSLTAHGAMIMSELCG